MEIVLAIALTSVVMYLLITAIELYMFRVDSSRSRVESAQLARTLLDKMAADLAATRLYATPLGGSAMGGGAGGGGGQAGGFQFGGAGGNSQTGGGTSGSGGMSDSGRSLGGGSGGGSSSGSSVAMATDVQGLFGAVEEIRIDRAAYPNWQRAAREVTPEEPASAADLPVSVRYWYVDGDQLSSQDLAKQGVSEEETAQSAGGLYRETIPTAAIVDDSDPLAGSTQRDDARVELLAPEVVKMEIAYFDGQDLVDAWDSLEEAGLPVGVEIRLTIHEPSFQDPTDAQVARARLTGQRYKENERVEYRRFVRLPKVSPPQPAEALLPAAGANGNSGGNNGDQRGDQNGNGGQNGGGQPGGGDGND